jgi:zinc transport system substrate-binding protein
MRYPLVAVVAVVWSALFPTAAICSTDVTATIFPIASIVHEIGGDRVNVTTLVPGGTDPHHFELTPRTARALHQADILFTIGGHFDHWIPEAPDREGPGVRIELYKIFTDSLLSIKDSFNPHFWLDPLYAKAIGKTVQMALCGVDPANCAYYEAGAQVFAARIDSLHSAARQRLDGTAFKSFVSFHPAWSYFARRYGILEVETIEISHDQEPSAKHIAGVVRKIKTEGVRYIVAEAFSNQDLAESIASQTDATVITLDPTGGAGRPERDSYFELMDYNISIIEQAGDVDRAR